MIERLFAAAVLLLVLGMTACREADVSILEAIPSPDTATEPAAERHESTLTSKHQPGGATDLSVMTWNLEWFFDDQTGDNFSDLAKRQSAPSRSDWNWKRNSVAQAVAAVAPTIAGLQEIENQRVLFYLKQALLRDHDQEYAALAAEGGDYYTEQDVGYLYRPQVDGLRLLPLRQTIFGRSGAMHASGQHEDVTKHLAVEFEVRLGDAVETLTIMNVHLRAGADASVIRRGQARSVHAWLADKIAAGENVIVLGDFNSVAAVPAAAGTEIHAALGKETAATSDDLVDLHTYLPQNERATHLQTGRALDRILVSPGLLHDAPDRVDLSFENIQRLKNLAVRGQPDAPGEHYDRYWQMKASERDISDHYPVMATFQFK